MQKRPIESNLSSINGVAVATNQSAGRYKSGNNISPNTINNDNQNNQQSQNSKLSRQQMNIHISRTNSNHCNKPNIASSSLLAQQANSLLLRNQNVMHSIGNISNESISQNQTTIGSQRNATYASNIHQFQQIENASRVPFTQSLANWQALPRGLTANSSAGNTMPHQSSVSNHDYSPRQVNSNVNYSNQNISHIVSRSSASCAETATVQSNKLPEMQANTNVENRNITLQRSGVIQKLNAHINNSQQAIVNQRRPPPPTYKESVPESLLTCLLKQNVNSVGPESEALKKVIEDRVYLQKQSTVTESPNAVSRAVCQKIGNVHWRAGSGLLRTLDNQNRNAPVQPQGHLLHNIGSSNTSIMPTNVNTQRATVANTNPNEISYQRIRQIVDVHSMRSYPSRNVPIAPRPNTNNVSQTVTVNKNQDGLPVITDVFTLPHQNMSTQSYSSSVNNITSNSNISVQHVSVNTSSPSLQSNNTTVDSQLNNNSGRSPVLRHSSEAPVVSTYGNTVSPQSSQILAPINNGSALMGLTVSAPTNTATSNFHLVYSNGVQSVVQSNSNHLSTLPGVNSVGYHMSSQSVSSLPYDNTNDFATSFASSGQPSSVISPSDDSFDLPSIIIHPLPSSVSEISEVLPITGDEVETDVTLGSQDTTCARSGCNQKSSKLCSVCKSTTYCSHNCQPIYAGRQGPTDYNVNQYSDMQLPDEYMDMSYLFSD